MKLLRVLVTVTAATLKTFRRHTVRNGVSPLNVNMIRGFAAAGNSEPESKKVGETASCLLKAMGLEPNLVSFNAVLQRLCQERWPGEAEEVLEEMNRKGLAPDERTYTSLIHMFCDEYQKEMAYKVLNEMIENGFSPSVVTYNKLIGAYCSSPGETVEEAVGILRGMAERGLSPDAVSYRHVIYKFCIVQLEKAFEMKVEMIEKGIMPDAETYSRLIRSCCWQSPRRLSKAFDLFREMLHWGILPDESTYTDLMDAYCLEGEFSKAFHLHEEVIHKGFSPDFVTGFSPSLVTCNALICGLCFSGRAEEALGILRGMSEMGFSPDTASYTIVVSGLCRIGDLRKAYDLKLEMDNNGDTWALGGAVFSSLWEGLLDKVAFTSVINAYCADGEVVKACALRDYISHEVSMPNSFTYDVLINGLDKIARTREAKEMLLSLFFRLCRWYPTLAYDTLIENCSNNELKSVIELVKDFRMRDLKNEAASVLNTIIQWNYKPDEAVYNLLIVEHCSHSRSDNVDKAYKMYTEMVHYGFAPHMFSALALITSLCYGERYNEMSWVIQNTLRSCNLNDSELHKVLNEVDVMKCKIDALLNVLAERAMDGLLLDGRKLPYASASA